MDIPRRWCTGKLGGKDRLPSLVHLARHSQATGTVCSLVARPPQKTGSVDEPVIEQASEHISRASGFLLGHAAD